MIEPTYSLCSRRSFFGALGACGIAAAGILVGCSSSSTGAATSSSKAASSAASSSAAQAASLSGASLSIYCGAGMTDPFKQIADLFAQETGCTMNVTYANSAQIQTQIRTTGEGDFWIAGSVEELNKVSDYVESQANLVRHIPVLVIPSSNPLGISGLADLEKASLVLIGDPESTPIGTIAKKALTDIGIYDVLESRGAISMTTTAPQISAALAQGQGDAGIVWKENVTASNTTIVATSDLDSYVKTIPAGLLKSVANREAASAFMDFLDTPDVQGIWQSFGYELA
ncbi:MAG: molybdate ABC transporter substrate-binding protein [Eggerthellaceae bacterium]|jgi:molybdate transport system substrate-binding protein